MKSFPFHEDTDPGFQIAPMVDVVFVLMIFFMACAGFRAQERELKIALPGPPQFPVTIREPIFLTIDAAGSVFVNDQAKGTADDHHLAVLTAWLRSVREAFGDGDTIVIRPAPTITHERVMEVLSATTAAGWQNLTFG